MYKPRRQEFLNIFYENIFPFFIQTEKLRIALIVLLTCATIGIMYAGFCIYTYTIKTTQNILNAYSSIPIIIIGAIILIILAEFGIRRFFVKYLKNKYMKPIIVFFNNMCWSNNPINSHELMHTHVFSKFDFNKTSCDDCFSGKYNNTSYKISEMNIINETYEYRRRVAIPVFNGIIFNFDLPNKISKNILISSKNMTLRKNFNLGNIIGAIFISVILMVWYINKNGIYVINSHNVILYITLFIISSIILSMIFYSVYKKRNPHVFQGHNDLKINKNFDVKSNNIKEIKEIATPEFFDKLNNIHRVFKSDGISFNTYKYDNKIKAMIIIPTKINAFEIGSLFKSLNKPQCMVKLFDQLECFMDLIDYFADIQNDSSN